MNIKWSFSIFAILFLFTGCGQRPEPVTSQMLDQMDSNWRASGIHDYRIVVDVERPGELRRHTITVKHDRITKGIVLYWEPKTKRWDNLITLNESQAIAFTVPGLLDTLRSELSNANRPVLRIATTDTPPYIKKILLGQIRQNDELVPGSQATIIVQQFQH